MIKFSHIIETDIIVAGSGLAGVRATYDAAASGKRVTLLTKGKLCSGSSFYPLTGGLRAQLPIDEKDKELYLNELLASGQGMASKTHCEVLVDSITNEITRLPDIGITPRTAYGREACFATTERRLEGWSGWDTIRKNVRKIFLTYSNLEIIEYGEIARIVVRDNSVVGAIAYTKEEELIFISAKAVILATGGMSALFQHNLTTDDVCGIGHSLALDAGVPLINLEFIQFIPGMTSPVYKLIFGEIILRYVDTIKDENGVEVLRKAFDDEGDYHTCLEQRAMHGPFTCGDTSQYFDILLMKHYIKHPESKGFVFTFKKDLLEDENPLVKEIPELYKKHKINITQESITLLPFAHCNNGGVSIQKDGSTVVKGLFAGGEVAGGVHGADRHGGAATAAALVFGALSAASAIHYCDTQFRLSYDADSIKNAFISFITPQRAASHDAIHIFNELRKKLFTYANVYRNKEGIEETLDWVKKMKEQFSPLDSITQRKDGKLALKTFHALRTSEALLLSLLERKESRGGHYRSDYPTKDPSLSNKRVIVSERERVLVASWI